MFFPFIFYLKQMLRITRDVSNHTNYSVRNPALLLILAPRISWIPKIKSSCIHDFRLEMKSWSFVPTYNLTYLHTYFFEVYIFILLKCCLFFKLVCCGLPVDRERESLVIYELTNPFLQFLKTLDKQDKIESF